MAELPGLNSAGGGTRDDLVSPRTQELHMAAEAGLALLQRNQQLEEVKHDLEQRCEDLQRKVDEAQVGRRQEVVGRRGLDDRFKAVSGENQHLEAEIRDLNAELQAQRELTRQLKVARSQEGVDEAELESGKEALANARLQLQQQKRQYSLLQRDFEEATNNAEAAEKKANMPIPHESNTDEVADDLSAGSARISKGMGMMRKRMGGMGSLLGRGKSQQLGQNSPSTGSSEEPQTQQEARIDTSLEQ